MVPKSSPLLAVALALAALALAPPCNAEPASGDKQGKGAVFMEWLGQELPVVALKAMECLKKNERDMTPVLHGLFADIGKCFDDAKGALVLTAECMLKNSMARMVNTLTVAQRVANCLGLKRSSRLCVSVSDVQDDRCPFLVGV